MRERRVGRVALPARLVAGAAGAAFLVTAAPPVYAQDEPSEGGEALCDLHDARLEHPSGIVAAEDGDGWWIVPSGENQNDTLSVMRVGEDCNVREADEAWIVHQPIDPQALALDTEGGSFLWVADTGGSDRPWLTLNQIEIGNLDNDAVFRFVFPAETHEVEAFVLLPGKKPLFVTADEGEAGLYSPPGENQAENTPLENVGSVALTEGGSVTGAALNADATKIALRTENAVYEWTVADGDAIAAITGSEPLVTPIETTGASEDLAYDAEGNFHVLSSTDGGDGVVGAIGSYTPAAPVAADPSPSEADEGTKAEEGPSLLDRILGLGFQTIVNILAAIAFVGLLVMVGGIMVIRKHKKAAAAEDDDFEESFAAEESVFAGEEPFLNDPADPVDLGLDAGQPDPDLGRVARGGVYGAPRQEPSGNVYGAPRGEGGVYGAPRQEPSGNVYGARPAPQQPGPVYGGREEPQYGAFEGGGHGSVYDNAGPGRSFTARPEPSGNVYGAKPARPAAPAGGSVYGGGANRGSVYGGSGGDRSTDADDGHWGPPEGGPARGRGR